MHTNPRYPADRKKVQIPIRTHTFTYMPSLTG